MQTPKITITQGLAVFSAASDIQFCLGRAFLFREVGPANLKV
jgi:hypothetical protein